MPKQTLASLPHVFTVHSLTAGSEIPRAVFDAPVYFIGKTNEELSLVVPETIFIDSEELLKVMFASSLSTSKHW